MAVEQLFRVIAIEIDPNYVPAVARAVRFERWTPSGMETRVGRLPGPGLVGKDTSTISMPVESVRDRGKLRIKDGRAYLDAQTVFSGSKGDKARVKDFGIKFR